MNTPSDEMIEEVVRCVKKQNKHEIWNLLFPLSIKYGFTLNSEYVIFKLISPFEGYVEDKFSYKLPLELVYGVLAKDGFLYVICYHKVFFILNMVNGAWRRYLPIYQPPMLKILCWNIQEMAKALGWLFGH